VAIEVLAEALGPQKSMVFGLIVPRRTRNAIIWRQVLIKAVEKVMMPSRL
jgi:hypothetical protein